MAGGVGAALALTLLKSVAWMTLGTWTIVVVDEDSDMSWTAMVDLGTRCMRLVVGRHGEEIVDTTMSGR